MGTGRTLLFTQGFLSSVPRYSQVFAYPPGTPNDRHSAIPIVLLILLPKQERISFTKLNRKWHF